MFPGAYPETIAVSAYDTFGTEAWFSNTGPETDLMAPGVNVVSTLPNNRYGSLSGTSMATPHVTGVVALMMAAAEKRNKVMTPDDVRTILVANSANGVIDLVAALKAVDSLPRKGGSLLPW